MYGLIAQPSYNASNPNKKSMTLRGRARCTEWQLEDTMAESPEPGFSSVPHQPISGTSDSPRQAKSGQGDPVRACALGRPITVPVENAGGRVGIEGADGRGGNVRSLLKLSPLLPSTYRVAATRVIPAALPRQLLAIKR